MFEKITELFEKGIEKEFQNGNITEHDLDVSKDMLNQVLKHIGDSKNQIEFKDLWHFSTEFKDEIKDTLNYILMREDVDVNELPTFKYIINVKPKIDFEFELFKPE